jgi:hypothetical protein
MWCQFIFEGAVAVRTFPEVVAVDPDFTVAIDPVKLDEDQFSFGRGGNRKCLAIPAKPTRQGASARARRSVFTEFAFDAPVVRQVQLPPLRIVETRVLRPADVTEIKAPVLIE